MTINVASMFIARCLLAAIAFFTGSALAWFGKEGWGWFLFVGVLAMPGFSTGGKDDDGA